MKRAVLVEDNPDVRLMVTAMLKGTYLVEAFASGTEALAPMAAARPDVVLMDISLPEQDGTEVLAAMRREDRLRAVPVVALTAHALPGDRERLLAEGFAEYVSKPIMDERDLVGAIERALGRAAEGGVDASGG